MSHPPDHGLESLREIRRSIAATHSHDPVRYAENLLQVQARYADKVFDPREAIAAAAWAGDRYAEPRPQTPSGGS
jgi:hypothetical protein